MWQTLHVGSRSIASPNTMPVNMTVTQKLLSLGIDKFTGHWRGSNMVRGSITPRNQVDLPGSDTHEH